MEIIISKKGDVFYADILRNVTADLALTALGHSGERRKKIDLMLMREQINLNNIGQDAIKRMRKVYRDTESIILSLPVEAAFQLVIVGKVRIGCVMRRIED